MRVWVEEKRNKGQNRAVGGAERGGKGPHRGQRPLPTPVYGLSSLRDPEQLGDYNHRGNAAGQADKRGLRAGLGGWSGLSVHLSVCLALSQNNRGKKQTAGSQAS